MSKTVRAHANIALIKYWGKKDEVLRLPSNSSLSLTLDAFYTDTLVEYDESLTADVFILNGEVQNEASSKRVIEFMNLIRRRYNISKYAKVTSENHVPTGAGLASSASAYAALAKAATLELDLTDRELSSLARMGSGSASRSIYGGFVRWNMGTSDVTSYAEPIAESWSEFTMIACMVNQEKKAFSSSEAMFDTSENSVYFDAWVEQSHKDIVMMEKYIEEKDIHKVGKLAQENALRMHASLLAVDKWYFEPKTIEIMNIVRELQNEIPVYFTMDAGPNVKILTLDKYTDQVLSKLGNIKTVIAHEGPGVCVL